MHRPRRGATLIELLVALVLLDLALLSLATIGAASAKRVGDARRRSHAAATAANRLERLASQPCSALSGGVAPLERGVLESWSATRVGAFAEVTDSVDLLSRPRETFVLRARVPCA